MTEIQKKYLKYKQKYINLKKTIGGGINASYVKKGNTLTLRYKSKDGIDHEIKYTIKEKIGEGAYGEVDLIEKNDDTTKQYIFKKGTRDTPEVFNEGLQSDMLEGILDPDMLVLFQGSNETDFLISTYNGKDLKKAFMHDIKKTKDKYATTTIQLLELLHKINRNNLFHNDIKLANITINDEDKVYLIDFGFLTRGKSNAGSLASMSFMGVITFLEEYNFNRYEKTFSYLKTILKNTDIIAFFYCCIHLLFLSNGQTSSSSTGLLYKLQVYDFEELSMNNLFTLYYFILPTSIRNTIPDIDMQSNDECDPIFSNSSYAKSIFGDFSDDNINLFRFMAYIYDKLNIGLNSIQQTWYIEFLKIMSTCFLPDFDYDKFKPIFNEIVLQFK